MSIQDVKKAAPILVFGEGVDSWEVIHLPDGYWVQNVHFKTFQGRRIERLGPVAAALVKELLSLKKQSADFLTKVKSCNCHHLFDREAEKLLKDNFNVEPLSSKGQC